MDYEVAAQRQPKHSVSTRLANSMRLHIPVYDRNRVLAFAVRGRFHFDYSAVGSATSFNNPHKSGFHIVEIAMWQCNGRWASRRVTG